MISEQQMVREGVLCSKHPIRRPYLHQCNLITPGMVLQVYKKRPQKWYGVTKMVWGPDVNMAWTLQFNTSFLCRKDLDFYTRNYSYSPIFLFLLSHTCTKRLNYNNFTKGVNSFMNESCCRRIYRNIMGVFCKLLDYSSRSLKQSHEARNSFQWRPRLELNFPKPGPKAQKTIRVLGPPYHLASTACICIMWRRHADWGGKLQLSPREGVRLYVAQSILIVVSLWADLNKLLMMTLGLRVMHFVEGVLCKWWE